MKKGQVILFLAGLCFAIILAGSAAASSCELNVKMINQDPYPATPDNYVKVVFQITGAENPDCGIIRFNLIPEFPFSLDPGQNSSLEFKAGAYAVDYSSSLTIPFKIRVDQAAVEGSNPIKISYAANTQAGQPAYVTSDFNIEVGNTMSDFDVVMQDITPQGTSFIVTNTGKNDANSVILTVESVDVDVSGPRSVVIGTLARGDYTIAHVRVVPKSGVTNLNVGLSYTDNSGDRINLEKIVPIESSSRVEQVCWSSSGSPYTKWIFGLVGIFLGAEAVILLRTLGRKKSN